MYSWWFLARFRKSETVKRFLLFLFFTFFSSLSFVFHAREMSSNEESEFLVNVSIIFKNHTIGIWNRIWTHPKKFRNWKNWIFSRTKMQMNYAKLTVSRSGFPKSFLMRKFFSEIFVEKLLKRNCWDGNGLSFVVFTTSKYMPRLFRHVILHRTKCQSRDGPIRYKL